ncbi:MarR family winged helix-turn-helix transcriptional regulator [Paenibacillus sp. FSL R7-0331]|uniref:MarR family winged helix-turn-helix transcriptional regulator n=1 Tax=Paenibacillus sp. FSL R7-0331 TaxID=1536773 RepID=UPI0004F7D85A|nr:MarR family transcriptional regulator [Paenibacillus sp. FSL R7-0331]AIQ52650.1 MarR family transcriptional regulator [Paenibacillus sp. FSL R7-0331]
MKDDLHKLVLEQPPATEAFFTLVETTANAVAVSEKYWQAHGLNGARIRILVEIAKHGGSILPSALAEKIGVSKANISLLLSPLEKEAYIARAGHAEDGRKTVISITEQGQSLLLEHLPENRQAVAEVMNRLDEQELRQLMRLLGKLNRP